VVLAIGELTVTVVIFVSVIIGTLECVKVVVDVVPVTLLQDKHKPTHTTCNSDLMTYWAVAVVTVVV